jgi:preprotein translocase subunit SecG
MQTALVALHLIICIALIVIVLLQTGKGSEIGAVFGSSSQTLFGSTGGGTFFGKLTTCVAVIFLLTSLILAGRANRVTDESVMSGVKPAATVPAPSGSGTPIEIPVTQKQEPAADPDQIPGAEQRTTAPTDSGERQTR